MSKNIGVLLYEPHHEKPDFCICENKGADQLRCHLTADQYLCFRYIDSTIPLLPKSKISSLSLSSVAVQLGLCSTWLETFLRHGSYILLMSHVKRKPTFCICKNKDADQLRGNREADQRLCFRYIDSTIPLLSKSEISSL